MAVAVGQPPGRRIARRNTVLMGSALLTTAGVVVTLLATLLLAGDQPARTAPVVVEVTEHDAGTTVRLSTGDTLEVTLEGNPTTGYTWDIATCDAAILAPVGEQEIVFDSAALGSGARVTTRFEAAAPGHTTLKMIYFRAFEQGVPPLKTFVLNVVVQKPVKDITTSLQRARTTLVSYFAALSERRYADAAVLYGGDYAVLRDWNPLVAPADHALLFEQGCRNNGLRCLKVRRVVSQEQISPSAFQFVLEFANDDGTLFKRALSEGASETGETSQTRFEYTVERAVGAPNGRFAVLALPIYTP